MSLHRVIVALLAWSAKKHLFPLAIFLACLPALVLHGTGTPTDFVFFQQQGKKIIPTVSVHFQTYLPLLEFLQLFDLPYTESASVGYVQIVVGKNIIRLTKDKSTAQVNEVQVQLPVPVTYSNDRWLVSPEFVTRVMNRVLPEKIQVDSSGRRFCLAGSHFSRLSARGISSDQGSRIIVHLSTPVVAEIRKEQSRMILSFGNLPIDPVKEDFQYRDSLVTGVLFEETANNTQLVVQLTDNTVHTRVAHLAEQNAYLLDFSRSSVGEIPTTNGGIALQFLSEKKPGLSGRKWHHVTVDPGHGGRDRGTMIQDGLYEKDVVLAVARKLRWILQSRLGVTVELSRSEDQTLSLDDRAIAANRAQSDLFISLHIGNWSHSRESKSFAYVAKMRGSGKLVGGGEELDVVDGPRASFLPWDRCQSIYLTRSSQMAGILQAEINRSLNGGDASLSFRQAPLRLLSSLAMSAVLLEIGNAAQPDFKKSAADPQFQDTVAAVVLTAVEKFRSASESP